MDTKRPLTISLAIPLLCVALCGASQISHCLAVETTTLSANGSGRATAYVESNKIITYGDKTHVAWLDSIEDGFRTRIRTLDRSTNTWSNTYTLGEAEDNHGGPSITIDSEGYLHSVYYPHHGPIRYRKSVAPNDASAWTEEVMVGEKLTYPSLVVGPDDTLYMVARTRSETSAEPWGVNLYSKPKNGAWSAPTEIIRAGENSYSQFQATLAWGPDQETLHLSTRMYGDTPRWGYKIGYMQSSDFGQSWKTYDGANVTLPATKNNIDTIESIDPAHQASFADASALRAGSIAVDQNNVPHVLYNTLGPGETPPLQSWLATPNGSGGWNKTLLNDKMDQLPEGWGLGTPGGITFTDDGRMALVLTAFESGMGWGSAGSEIYGAVSNDGGATFDSKFLSEIDPNTPHWLPSIERATGFNEVDSVSMIYTSGIAGEDNNAILENDVVFRKLLGKGWNGLAGDVNQNGILFGDGTGPAHLDDVTAFIEHWKADGLPGLFGTYESMTHGDLNFDGTTDAHDVLLLRKVLIEAGISSSALAQLNNEVPEPSSLPLFLAGVLACFATSPRRMAKTIA